MEFSGEFELESASPEEAWVMLSDPIAVCNALKGCRYIAEKDEEFSFEDYEPQEDVATLPEADLDEVTDRTLQEGVTYAALLEVGVGSVKPRFETEVTIQEREFPRMVATGSGSASSSSFQMESWMEISETDTGTLVEWASEADVSGRVAQLGGRVLNPVADKIVNDFFSSIEQQMIEVEESEESSGIKDRLRSFM